MLLRKKGKKYGFNNFEVAKLNTGKCKFKVFQNPLSTEQSSPGNTTKMN